MNEIFLNGYYKYSHFEYKKQTIYSGGILGIGSNETKSQHLLMREYRIYAVYVLHTVFN